MGVASNLNPLPRAKSYNALKNELTFLAMLMNAVISRSPTVNITSCQLPGSQAIQRARFVKNAWICFQLFEANRMTFSIPICSSVYQFRIMNDSEPVTPSNVLDQVDPKNAATWLPI